MNDISNLPISFLTDTATNAGIILFSQKTSYPLSLKNFLTLETFSLIKAVAKMGAAYTTLNWAIRADKFNTKMNGVDSEGNKVQIGADENFTFITDFLKNLSLNTAATYIPPAIESFMQFYLMHKSGLSIPASTGISIGLFALKMKQFNPVDEWSGFATKVSDILYNNFIDTEELKTIALKYINNSSFAASKEESQDITDSEISLTTYMLSQNNELNGYIKINYNDLKDKKLCLDTTAQKQWVEVATTQKHDQIHISSQSTTGIYEECPPETINAQEFVAENNDLSKVHYFITKEDYHGTSDI